MSFYRAAVNSPMGRFVLEANDAGLSRVLFPEHSAQLKPTAGTIRHIEEAAKQLKLYLEGEAYDFKSLDYDFSSVTDFQAKILRTLLNATQATLSYSELAELAGNPNSSRAVGTTMNKNPFPILIPCHRVIQANGDLGLYAFGQAWKKRLLEHEKIATATAVHF